jgi:hypothetical protein
MMSMPSTLQMSNDTIEDIILVISRDFHIKEEALRASLHGWFNKSSKPKEPKGVGCNRCYACVHGSLRPCQGPDPDYSGDSDSDVEEKIKTTVVEKEKEKPKPKAKPKAKAKASVNPKSPVLTGAAKKLVDDFNITTAQLTSCKPTGKRGNYLVSDIKAIIDTLGLSDVPNTLQRHNAEFPSVPPTLPIMHDERDLGVTTHPTVKTESESGSASEATIPDGPGEGEASDFQTSDDEAEVRN